MSDTRAKAIKALAEALARTNVTEAPENDASVLVLDLDAHPEAKAALAAWLIPGVVHGSPHTHDANGAIQWLKPVVADTTEEEKYGPAATARIHASLDARYCFIRNCNLPHHKGSDPMTPAAGSEPGGEGPLTEDEEALMRSFAFTNDHLRIDDQLWGRPGIKRLFASLDAARATPPSSVAERGGLREALRRIYVERDLFGGQPDRIDRAVEQDLPDLLAAVPVAATLDVERLARALSGAYDGETVFDGERRRAIEVARRYARLASQDAPASVTDEL